MQQVMEQGEANRTYKKIPEHEATRTRNGKETPLKMEGKQQTDKNRRTAPSLTFQMVV